MKKLTDRTIAVIESMLALLLAAMVVLVFGNVVLRYAFHTGIIVSEELSRFLMVWLVFLGAVVAMREGAHLGSDTLLARLPRAGQRSCAAVSNVLILFCCGLLALGLWRQHELYADTVAPVSGLPMIWVYGIGYLTAAGIALVVLQRLRRIVRGDASPADLGLPSNPRTAMTVVAFLFSLLGALMLGMPVAFALLLCGLALMLTQGMTDPTVFAQKLLEGADSFTLLAIPFFMLAGELMTAGGLSRRIVNFALAWVGHLRGGLGFVAIFASLVLAALSGSAAADAAILGAMLIPMMRDNGYDVPRSAGLIAAGSVIAPVLPPSVALIVFGVVANVSIGKLFLAAIVPGLLMGLALLVSWAVVSRRDDTKILPRQPMAVRLRAGVDAIWALGMPVGIVLGMRFGIVTPTEAAVAACVYAFVVGMFIYRELRWRDLHALFVRSAKATAVVVFLISAALVSAWLITVSNVPDQVGAMLRPFMDSPKLLMFVIMVMVAIIGTALDFAPTVMILTPVLMPIVAQAGIDPVYFGVLFVMNNAIGLVTPPVGIVLNVLSGVASVPLDSVAKGALPFLLAQFAILLLLVAFPFLVLGPLQWLR